MTATQIKKGTFKHVESELFAYHETRKEMIRLRNEILYQSGSDDNIGGGRSNIPGDPTGRTVIRMVSSRRLNHLQDIIDTIEEVYNALPEEKKRLVNLYYWTKPQPLTWEGISRKLNVSRRQAMRWRDEVVFAISDRMGWRQT